MSQRGVGTDEPAVRVDNLRVVRGGRVVLAGLSLEVASGAVTGLLGPSGSGKTTLMRAVVGVQRIITGAVTVLGAPAGTAGLRRDVGYVTQSPAVYPDLTVSENLRYFAATTGAPRARVSDVLREVGLSARADQLTAQLSGGERARLSLATALLPHPRLLVLDEPTVGLDPVLRRDLWTLFHELAHAGATLLVSSHVMQEAQHCDTLLLLREGVLLFAGTPTQLQARTHSNDLDDAFLSIVEQQEG
jgi:ABC-2 type transport system ATP-binding protein